MHDYLFSVEVVRFAFLAGVAVSMLLYERRHLTTGSLVVPGYVAVFLVHPLVLVATFLNALVTFWFVNRVLARRILLYGRTKFSVLALISIAIQAVMLKLSPSGSYLWETDVPLFVGVGYVIPALIAHDMARQGVTKTIRSVLLAGILVGTPIGVALWLVPGTQASGALVGFGVMALRPAWIPLAVLISAATSWGLLRNHGLRAGGFVGAAYLGMLAADPLQILFVAGIAMFTYLVVHRLLQPWMILFGRRKFSAMLLVSGVLSWTAMWSGTAVLGYEVSYYLTLSSVALTPLFVPGLVANDMERSGVARVVAGTVLGAAFVVPAVLAISTVVDTGVTSVGWTLVALASGSIVFGPQIRWVGTTTAALLIRLLRGAGGRHRPPLHPVEPPVAVPEPTRAPPMAPLPPPQHPIEHPYPAELTQTVRADRPVGVSEGHPTR